jgi:predicted transcriptional regulator
MSEEADVVSLTAAIVSSYVQTNRVAPGELPALIESVHAALGGTSRPEPELPPAAEKVTAAQVRKSITPEGLISFEDNKRYQSLKRHLSTRDSRQRSIVRSGGCRPAIRWSPQLTRRSGRS